MGLQMCSITCPLNPHSLCPRISHITSGVSVSTAALLLSLVGRERDARSPSLHCLQGCSICAEAIAEHLDFVVMQRLVQRRTLTCHSDQTASELAGVAKRAVGTRAVSWHDMDGITEQSDVAGVPVLDGNATSQGQEKGLLRVRLLSKGRQRRIPIFRQ